MKTIAHGTAALLILSAAQAAFPDFFYFLPLGGSPMAETGIVLSMSLAIKTLLDANGKDPHDG